MDQFFDRIYFIGNAESMTNLIGYERRTDRIESRLSEAITHVPRYSGRVRMRLSADSGVPKTTLRRLLKGHCNPSFLIVCRVISAIERQTGKRLDPRELFSEGGAFLSDYVCEAMDCSGCLPEESHDSEGNLTPKYKDVRPGQWGPKAITGEDWLEIKEIQ